jgi:hypothetical protein
MNELRLLGLLGAGPPADEPAARERARLQLVAAIELEEARRNSSARSLTTRRRRLMLIPAIAVLGAILVAVPPLLGGSSAAALALRALSKVAREQPPVGAGGGEFVYTRTVGTRRAAEVGLGQDTVVFTPERFTREVWMATDGSGRVLDGDRDEEMGAGGLAVIDGATLPSDPDELQAAIETGEVLDGTGTPASTFDVVGNLLRESYLAPDLRSALFQVAADIEGVELVGTTQDRLGREGIAVAHTDAGIRHELIFDEKSSALLGEQRVVVDPTALASPGDDGSSDDLQTGETLFSAAYSDPAIVGSVNERP